MATLTDHAAETSHTAPHVAVGSSEFRLPASVYRSCSRCRAPFRTDVPRCPRDGAPLVHVAADPLLGLEIDGRYRLEAFLAEGGLGRVYRARHTRMSRLYAVKIPFGELMGDATMRIRLANEAEAASRVDHPNLVGVIDVGETEAGLFYLVMELVDGEPLDVILARGPLKPRRALDLIAQIADGLAHAHARGLVHRDLKPENILVERYAGGAERARIVDFGIALIEDDPRRRVTAKGMVIGTPDYMAPEQLIGQRVDARADLFALGLILHEMLAGSPPFPGASLEVAMRRLNEDVPRLAARTPPVEVDGRIETLIRWLTQRRRADRPGSAALVSLSARTILAGASNQITAEMPRPTAPASVAPVARTPVHTARRRPRRWSPAQMLTLSLLLLGLLLLLLRWAASP